jgi:hypothetical protein
MMMLLSTFCPVDVKEVWLEGKYMYSRICPHGHLPWTAICLMWPVSFWPSTTHSIKIIFPKRQMSVYSEIIFPCKPRLGQYKKSSPETLMPPSSKLFPFAVIRGRYKRSLSITAANFWSPRWPLQTYLTVIKYFHNVICVKTV